MFTRYSVKYILALCATVLLSLCAWAEPRMNKPHNYLWLSLAGGEANNLSYNTDIKAKAGAGANLGLGYELQYGNFMFGVGLEANYQLQRDQMATYLEEYDRRDRTAEAVKYGYYHQNYWQNDQTIRLAVPVYIGGRGEYFYALVGASVNLPVWNSYQVNTQMLTQGTYAWSIEPVRTQGINDFTSYGYYANANYQYKANYKDKLSIHARAEIGSFIPLEEITKIQLRVGAYCSYGFRMGTTNDQNLLNLSKVDLNVYSQNEANLKANIAWHALNTSNLYHQLPHNLEVGVKLTVLMNVDVTTAPCHCIP